MLFSPPHTLTGPLSSAKVQGEDGAGLWRFALKTTTSDSPPAPPPAASTQYTSKGHCCSPLSLSFLNAKFFLGWRLSSLLTSLHPERQPREFSLDKRPVRICVCPQGSDEYPSCVCVCSRFLSTVCLKRLDECPGFCLCFFKMHKYIFFLLFFCHPGLFIVVESVRRGRAAAACLFNRGDREKSEIDRQQRR